MLAIQGEAPDRPPRLRCLVYLSSLCAVLFFSDPNDVLYLNLKKVMVRVSAGAARDTILF